MTAFLNSLRGFYGEGALPGTMAQRFFTGDRAMADLPGPKKHANISKRRGEFNG
jgi:hypothetical protein